MGSYTGKNPNSFSSDQKNLGLHRLDFSKVPCQAGAIPFSSVAFHLLAAQQLSGELVPEFAADLGNLGIPYTK